MAVPDEAHERMVLLETKVAYLEKIALELSDVIVEQGRSLDDLHKRFEVVKRQLEEGPDGEAPPHEKPPHY